MDVEHKFLIIYSDLKNCKAIKYALTDYDISAYYPLSVMEGIEHLMHHSYEFVISDISLSEADGLQLLRFIRQMRIMHADPSTAIPKWHKKIGCRRMK